MKVLLGAVLLTALIAEGYSLVCHSCNSYSGTCMLNSTVCNTTNHSTCRSITVNYIHGNTHSEYIVNGCGNCFGLISFNSGQFTQFQHSKCCSSDLCNDEVEPEKEDPTLNGLECKGCFTLTEAGCMKTMTTVKCRGQQDHCIHTSGSLRWADSSTYVFKGCASDFVCQETGTFEVYGLYPTNAYYCCKDNICNLESRNFTRSTTPLPATTNNADITTPLSASIGTTLLLVFLKVVL
uniref:phospholipase A2 inhibitor gamma subunit B-like n=1 Tax=Pristiophorus japonicus TaxID=55135 RepID=UPI00398E42C0